MCQMGQSSVDGVVDLADHPLPARQKHLVDNTRHLFCQHLGHARSENPFHGLLAFVAMVTASGAPAATGSAVDVAA
eukprot:NODE_1753_length_1069_cov_179.128205.p2 GENE.NODE_1753_length_1069_cov_179.128205~~NODE_1753_length_1069_cov_179.128205.p2  ORF type:complete len:76 (-),score=13.39 NODE_1753_length_1069_cov_179.128205:183-410(-)